MQEVGPGHAFAPVLPAKEARTLAGLEGWSDGKGGCPREDPEQAEPDDQPHREQTRAASGCE